MADEYVLTAPVEKFEKGQKLDVAARYGADHMYDVRLTPSSMKEQGSVELTNKRLGEVARPA